MIVRATQALVMAAALIGLSTTVHAQGNAVGSVTSVRNDVRLRPAASRAFVPARPAQRLALRDELRTGERSHLQALLLDRSMFTVGPNARLVIDRFVYDPARSSFSTSIATGAFRFISGGRRGAAKRTITTPAATIGIRGTIVDGVVGQNAVAIAALERAFAGAGKGDPAGATLVVLRGPGPQSEGGGQPGTIDVAAGGVTAALDRPLLAVYVPRAGARPSGPFPISLPALAALDDLILPPMSRRIPERAAPLPSPDRDRRPYVPGYPRPPGSDHQPSPAQDAGRVIGDLLEPHVVP